MKTELVLFALVVGVIATSGCIDGQEAPELPEDDFEDPGAPEDEPGEEEGFEDGFDEPNDELEEPIPQ